MPHGHLLKYGQKIWPGQCSTNRYFCRNQSFQMTPLLNSQFRVQDGDYRYTMEIGKPCRTSPGTDARLSPSARSCPAIRVWARGVGGFRIGWREPPILQDEERRRVERRVPERFDGVSLWKRIVKISSFDGVAPAPRPFTP